MIAVRKISKISSGVLAALLCSTPLYANDLKCSYSSITDTEFAGKIDKHEVTERAVLVLDRDKEMSSCHMTITATINDKPYMGHGQFIFGPDMSRNDACDQALTRAKEDALNEAVPEILNRRVDQKCGSNLQPAPPAQPVTPVTTAPLTVSQKKCRPHRHWITVLIDNNPVMAWKEVCL